MLPTTPQRATHDYERNGTCDLFAALNMATGSVITDIRKSHTSVDFIAFLNLNMATGSVITDIRKSHTSVDFIAFLNKGVFAMKRGA